MEEHLQQPKSTNSNNNDDDMDGVDESMFEAK